MNSTLFTVELLCFFELCGSIDFQVRSCLFLFFVFESFNSDLNSSIAGVSISFIKVETR